MLFVDRFVLTFMFFGLAQSIGGMLGHRPASVLELVVGMGSFLCLWQLFAYVEKKYKKGEINE